MLNFNLSHASILQNALRSKGGFTYSARSEALVSGHGYAVAVKGHERVYDGYPTDAGLFVYAHTHASALSQPDHYFGGWYYDMDGKTYLDVSVIFADYDEAVEEAKRRGELAIYDLASGQDHNV